MKAVIMAGGEGTRLRPLTSLRPKPMVPIVNRPVMEHIVGLCHWHGIDEIVATLQFLPQVIQDYFGDGEEWGVSFEYAVEDTPMGTAGSVKNAEALLGDEPFVVISGDALTDIDLTEVVEFHKAKGAAVTIALKRVPDPLEFGVVITDEDGRIERFLEKPTWGQVFSDTINTGIYVIEPEVMQFVPKTGQFDFSADLFPLLMEKGYPLYGCVVDGYWEDIGSLQSYIQAHWDILDGKVGVYIPGVKAANEVWIGEGADVSHDAFIGNHVVIGANAKIRAGALHRGLLGHRRLLPGRRRRARRALDRVVRQLRGRGRDGRRGRHLPPHRHPGAGTHRDRRRDRRRVDGRARGAWSAPTSPSSRTSASTRALCRRPRSSGRAGALGRCSAPTACPGSSASTSRPSSRCGWRRRTRPRCRRAVTSSSRATSRAARA